MVKFPSFDSAARWRCLGKWVTAGGEWFGGGNILPLKRPLAVSFPLSMQESSRADEIPPKFCVCSSSDVIRDRCQDPAVVGTCTAIIDAVRWTRAKDHRLGILFPTGPSSSTPLVFSKPICCTINTSHHHPRATTLLTARYRSIARGPFASFSLCPSRPFPTEQTVISPIAPIPLLLLHACRLD